MKAAVIIPAAGASTRYGGVRPKIDEDLGGRPVLQRTVELFTNRDDVGVVVVAGPAADEAWAEFMLRHGDRLGLMGVAVCRGGRTHRYESVGAALAFLRAGPQRQAYEACTHIAVHDAARPAAPSEMIERVMAAAEHHPAVIPGVDLPDTIKRVSATPIEDKRVDPLDAILGEFGKPKAGYRAVEATLPREHIVLVQTPQVFEKGLFERMYAQADLSSTDDAQLAERLGERVVVVEGDARNVKITRQGDLPLVRNILSLKPPAERETHKKF